VEKLAYLIPLAACVYLLVSCWWVREYFRTEKLPKAAPTNTAQATVTGAPVGVAVTAEAPPPVSILKPVRGLDEGAYENFASFFHQDYPEYEILFAVAEEDDPAVPLIRHVIAEHPERPARLLTEIPPLFPNPKVNSLARLTEEAAYSWLVISDSDIRVRPSYLRQITAPLADPQVGMVTCCYRGVAPRTLTAKLEALYMGVTFLPQVVVARRFLAMHFALGATIALRKADLERIGGWGPVGDRLAEDTHLARRIRAAGLEVVLSRYIADCYLGTTTWREQWDREVRWARTNRVNRPREYPGILLTLPLPLALVLLPLDPRGAWGWSAIAGALAVRWATAWLVTGFTDNRPLRRWLAWLPLRDCLSGLVWCAGLCGRKVVWRGTIHHLDRGGRLTTGPALAALSLETSALTNGTASAHIGRGVDCDRSGPLLGRKGMKRKGSGREA